MSAASPALEDARPPPAPRELSPRSRSASSSPVATDDDVQLELHDGLPLRRPAVPQKLSSSFCVAFLLFTTSLVFAQMLFLNGSALSYSAPLICDPSSEVAPTLHQKAVFAESARLRFPRTKRRLPQCIIIGARKCGTRALLEFLNLHPMVQKAAEEVHFFDDDERYGLGLDWYRRRMPWSFPGQVTIEKSPAYFVTAAAPARIRRMDPSVRLLLIVRDPVTRLVSDYAQLASNRARRRDRARVPAAFEDLVLRADGTVNLGYKAVRVGLYALFFPRWLRTFPRDQIHVVDGDRLVADPHAEVRLIERFLGLEHRVSRDSFYYNATKGFFCVRNATADKCLNDSKGRKHPNVSSDVLSTLRRFYAPHNKQFYRQAGVNFSWPTE